VRQLLKPIYKEAWRAQAQRSASNRPENRGKWC